MAVSAWYEIYNDLKPYRLAPVVKTTAESKVDESINSISPTGFLGGEALADAMGIHPTRRKAFFRQVERKRMTLEDDRWQEVHNPRSNSPRYLYLADSPTLQNIAAKYRKPV